MSDPVPVAEPGPEAGPARAPLAAKAMSESFGQLRYRDTSLLVWQQQQQHEAAPTTYLNRSRSSWYTSYGNQAVLIRDRKGQQDGEGQSRICRIM